MNLLAIVPLLLAATASASIIPRQEATIWSAPSPTSSASWSSSTSAPSTSSSSSNSSIACNNSPSLCSKSYSSILHLGTHGAPFLRTKENNWATAGNQYYDVKTQLSAGVRMIQAQMQLENGVARMCHTSCSLLDAGTLTDFLTDIKEWMDENPNEVVTILLVNPDRILPTQLDPAFVSSGLTDLIFRPTGNTWPTLSDMIAAKKRIVAFLSTTPNPPSSYLLPEFQYIYETAYENTSPGNFSCAKDRGSGSIPLINQFIYQDGLIQQPNETYSAVINGNSGLGNMRDRITGCGVKAGFVLVDFFRGDKELQIVDAINGVEDATGRKSVPALDRDGSASTKDGESAATSLKAGWGLAVGLFSVGVMMATL